MMTKVKDVFHLSFLTGFISLLVFSCSGNSNNNKVVNTNSTVLKPDTVTVNGVFSDYFQIVNEKYEYKITEPTSEFGLPSFEMPIKFKILDKFDYNRASQNVYQYRFNFNFIDKEGNIINPLAVESDFEVIKYYLIKGINFKELLTAEEGQTLSFPFQTYVDKENVELINQAETFEIEIFENTPSARLKQVSNSFDRAGEIVEIKLDQGKTAIVKYEKQNHDTYWDTGKKIEKAMIDIPARLMMKLDFIDQVELTIPFTDKTYYSQISRSQIEKYTGLSFEKDRSLWKEKFTDVYVYQLNNPKREAYFKKFVIIK